MDNVDKSKQIIKKIEGRIKRDFILTLSFFIICWIPRNVFIYSYLDFLFPVMHFVTYVVFTSLASFFVFGLSVAIKIYFFASIFAISSYAYLSGGVFNVPGSWYFISLFLFFYYCRTFKKGVAWSVFFLISVSTAGHFADPINLYDYNFYPYLVYYDIFLASIFTIYFCFRLKQHLDYVFDQHVEVYSIQKILSSIFHHDLANSFTGAQLNLKLKNQRLVEDSFFNIINTSRNAVRIGDILNHKKITLEKINIYRAINEAIFAHKNYLEGKNLKVEFLNTNDDIYISGSAELFRISIMGNLLSNAIKFSHPGGKIGIYYRKDHLKQMIYLIIKDSGVGIPKKMLASVLKFRSGCSTRLGTEKEEGNGFGLAIVKSIVEQWGGEIKVDSLEGKGTTITLSFIEEKDTDSD